MERITPLLANPGARGGDPADAFDDRLMYRLAYRNFGDHEAVVNHSVRTNQRVGVRWYEVRDPAGAPSLYQSGTFAPGPRLFRWMGSVAMNKAGDIALGYSTSSPEDYPSIAYTGRTAGDPLGQMDREQTVVSGSGSQNGGLTRWGDYSAMSVDPEDDCTFYYTQEYQKNTGAFNWSTRINSFKFQGCR